MLTYSTLLDVYILFNYSTYVISYVILIKYDYLEYEYNQKQAKYEMCSDNILTSKHGWTSNLIH